MELTGADDKVLPGSWNSTTRTIHIDHEAQPEPMPSAAPAASASAAPAHKK